MPGRREGREGGREGGWEGYVSVVCCVSCKQELYIVRIRHGDKQQREM